MLGQLIEAQRARLLQAHAIMMCLREALLYADADEATVHAEAANAAAEIADGIAENLDSARLKPIFDALQARRAH